MPSVGYATRVGFERERSIFGGAVGLFFATGTGLMAHGWIGDLLRDLRYLAHRTPDMRRAHWAWMTAGTALAAMLTAATVWLVASSLRAALALPPRPASRYAIPLAAVRIVTGIVLSIMLFGRTLSEYAMLDAPFEPMRTFVLALALVALFAYDAPRLFRNAAAALRARAPMLGARFVSLDQLPATGRVRVRAKLAAELPLEAVAEVELEGAHGARATLGIDPRRFVLVAEQGQREEAPPRALPAGTEVLVVGSVHADGGAYRGRTRIDAGDAAVHVYVGSARLTRRLLVAAVVELLAAIGLSACFLGMTGFFGYLALRVAAR